MLQNQVKLNKIERKQRCLQITWYCSMALFLTLFVEMSKWSPADQWQGQVDLWNSLDEVLRSLGRYRQFSASRGLSFLDALHTCELPLILPGSFQLLQLEIHNTSSFSTWTNHICQASSPQHQVSPHLLHQWNPHPQKSCQSNKQTPLHCRFY